jgi:hypothetical protein
MASSGMFRRVVLVRTDVSEELRDFFIRVTRIGGLGTRLGVNSNRRTLRRNTKVQLVTGSVVPSSAILVNLMKEAQSSSETLVLTRATWRPRRHRSLKNSYFHTHPLSSSLPPSLSHLWHNGQLKRFYRIDK